MEINGTRNELQQNEDWTKKRLGRFSCSKAWRLMSEPKLKSDKESGNLSEGAMTYVMECVAEHITGIRAVDTPSNKYFEWGNDHEPIAIGIYEHIKNLKITMSSYIPFGNSFGGSPDGLVLEDGIIEIKCPYTITAHLNHILIKDFKKEAKEYFWQCIGYLLITKRDWIDFVSYQPNYPGKYQFKVKRMFVKEYISDIKLLEQKVNKATEKFNELIASL